MSREMFDGGRKQSATVDLKVRMKEPLRSALERAAKQRGVSMNAEAVDRLEKSFAEQGYIVELLGGRAVMRKVQLMVSAFNDRLAG